MRGPLSRRCVLCAVLAGRLIAGAAAPAQGADAKEKAVSGTHRAQWFYEAKWGVFTHYLTGDRTTVEQWNKQVDAFDVPGLTAQLTSVRAPYYAFTLGQNSGHYCTPNATYDRLVGIRPSKCARRDLIADLSDALTPKGIRLMVYLPAGAPDRDPRAMAALKWRKGAHRNRDFQLMWQAVIREWSTRWGRKIAGWWFDGAYWPDAMYRHKEPPNFASFAAAARAGNPDSIIAFNPGVRVPILCHALAEDYTAGEINNALAIGAQCGQGRYSRWVDSAQLHMLSFLGPRWGSGKPRYTNEQVVEITRNVIACDGVVTWDVPIRVSGLIEPAHVEQLKALSKALADDPPKRRSRTPVPKGNLACSKPATITDLAGTKTLPANSEKHFSWLGVDGDLSTRAQGSREWPWAYTVDLQEAAEVGRVVVTFARGAFATEYKIALSADRQSWQVAAHVTGCKGGRQVHTLEPSRARYVRILGIKPDGPGQEGTQMAVAELEVYRK